MSYPQPPPQWGPQPPQWGPQGYPPPPPPKSNTLKIVALVAVVGVCALCTIPAFLSQSFRQGFRDEQNRLNQVTNPSARTTPTTPAGPRWEYRNSRDEMRGTSTQVACLPSTTRLQFDFPYQGGSTAHLCFRQNAQGLDAWLDVDRGQFLCHTRNCAVSMKFDGGAVVSFGGDRPSDGTSTMIFLDGAAQILASTRTAHRILIEAEFYRAGAQQIAFDDAGGLVWPPGVAR